MQIRPAKKAPVGHGASNSLGPACISLLDMYTCQLLLNQSNLCLSYSAFESFLN